MKQRGTQPSFKRPDHLADRGRRDTELAGGSRKALMAGAQFATTNEPES